MAQKRGRCVALACAVCLAAMGTGVSEADAAGFFLPGRGVKPLGRAGAYIASGGQNLNSLWYNPANLAGMEELQLTVDLALIDLAFEFQRAPRTAENGETITYDPVENSAAPQPNPQILVGGPINDRWSWGAGLYAPYLAGQTFPEDGAQRYTMVNTAGSLVAYTHLALAWQMNDALRVGFGFQNVVADFQLVNVTSAYTGLYGRPEDRDLDILTRITITDLFNASGNFGAWIKFSPMLQAAISVQLPVTIRDDDAQIETRLPDNAFFANAEVNGDSIDASLTFPFMARAGLRFVKDAMDAEVAVVYENWGTFDEIQANPNDVTVEGLPGVDSIRVAPLAVPLNWQDTFSVRGGGSYAFNEQWTGRLGYAFETNVAPDEYYSVFLADANKHLLTLGGSWSGESWSVDSSLAYYLMPDRTITNSEVRQINPTDAEGENTTVVGNGEYMQRFAIFGLGINKKF